MLFLAASTALRNAYKTDMDSIIEGSPEALLLMTLRMLGESFRNVTLKWRGMSAAVGIL